MRRLVLTVVLLVALVVGTSSTTHAASVPRYGFTIDFIPVVGNVVTTDDLVWTATVRVVGIKPVYAGDQLVLPLHYQWGVSESDSSQVAISAQTGQTTGTSVLVYDEAGHWGYAFVYFGDFWRWPGWGDESSFYARPVYIRAWPYDFHFDGTSYLVVPEAGVSLWPGFPAHYSLDWFDQSIDHLGIPPLLTFSFGERHVISVRMHDLDRDQWSWATAYLAAPPFQAF